MTIDISPLWLAFCGGVVGGWISAGFLLIYLGNKVRVPKKAIEYDEATKIDESNKKE